MNIRKYKNKGRVPFYITLFTLLFTLNGCSDMLSTDNDGMVSDYELNTKTDSVFYALGIAQAMLGQDFNLTFSGVQTVQNALATIAAKIIATTPTIPTILRVFPNFMFFLHIFFIYYYNIGFLSKTL